MSRTLNCRKCDYLKPRCNRGKRIHKKMVTRLLKRNLDMDDKHLELWNKWITHTED